MTLLYSNKFKSPLREYYPEFKDNGYSSKPSKKENMYHLQQYYNTQQPKEKFQSILTQNFKNYKDSSDINKNNQYLNIASTPLKEEELITSFENNTPSSEKNYTTYTQPINTDICNMPKVVKNLFGKKISIKNYSNLTKGGKEEDGLNKINQDSYISLTNINNIKDFNIFGVLDGHGPDGHFVSEFASEFIPSQIINHPEIKALKDPQQIYLKLKENNCNIITQAFVSADEKLKNLDFDSFESGSTCCLVIHIGTHIICANSGDSRALVVFDHPGNMNKTNFNLWNVTPLSVDFKPEMPEERERILMSGGVVEQMKDELGEGCGPYRVWIKGKDYPGLAMSRSIGDLKGKEVGVIPNPGILEYDLNSSTRFVIACSDGVFEFMNNQTVMELGKKFFRQNDASAFCHELVRQALIEWETNDNIVDDITAVVAFF